MHLYALTSTVLPALRPIHLTCCTQNKHTFILFRNISLFSNSNYLYIILVFHVHVFQRNMAIPTGSEILHSVHWPRNHIVIVVLLLNV